MVYRVRYRGGDFRPAADKIAGDDVYERMESVRVDKRKFFPMFLLRNQVNGRQYLDRLLPTARQKIKVREQISAPLYNSVEISRIDIPYSNDKSSPGVWGVATWVDVDPKLDFVSVEVFGLTNAFERTEDGGVTAFKQKGLQLNSIAPVTASSKPRISFALGFLLSTIRKSKNTFWTSTAWKNASIIVGYSASSTVQDLISCCFPGDPAGHERASGFHCWMQDYREMLSINPLV